VDRVRALVVDKGAPNAPNLTHFLRATSDSSLPSAERLRVLAIVVDENMASSCSPEQRWAALQPVYDEALRLAPESTLVWQSRSISALDVACSVTSDSESRLRFWRMALHAARNAVAYAQNAGDAHYALGQVHYWAEPPQLEDALAEFREAGGGLSLA